LEPRSSGPPSHLSDGGPSGGPRILVAEAPSIEEIQK